jgi:hypothetical protein
MRRFDATVREAIDYFDGFIRHYDLEIRSEADHLEYRIPNTEFDKILSTFDPDWVYQVPAEKRRAILKLKHGYETRAGTLDIVVLQEDEHRSIHHLEIVATHSYENLVEHLFRNYVDLRAVPRRKIYDAYLPNGIIIRIARKSIIERWHQHLTH